MRKLLTIVLPVVALGLLAAAGYLGLSWAPPDREMGDVQRIMYVHVPSVWMALLATTLNFGTSLAYLFRKSVRTDALAEAAGELAVVFGANGVLLGAIWGRPTWGVWWDWDPRITSAAIMVVAYMGYLALRRFVDDTDKRAVWSAVTAIIIYVDIPIVWFSVRWWRSLHQVQSSPRTVDPQMVLSLRTSAFAFLAFLILFLWKRYELARDRLLQESTPPQALPQTTVSGVAL